MDFIKIDHPFIFFLITLIFISIGIFLYRFYLNILKKEKKLLLSTEKKIIKIFLGLELILLSSLFLFSVSFTGIKIKSSKEKGIVYLILIDTSGSMNANDMKPSRIEVAKEITKKFISENTGLFGIITFNNYPNLLIYPTNDKELIFKKIDEIKAEGGTDMGDALNLAYSILDNFPGYKKVIILLSDGEPTLGPDPLKVVEQNKNKAQIFTIAIGKENVILGYDMFGNPLIAKVDKELLKKISELTNGKFFEAREANELLNIYKQISKNVNEEYYTYIDDKLRVSSFVLLLLYFFLRIFLTLLK